MPRRGRPAIHVSQVGPSDSWSCRRTSSPHNSLAVTGATIVGAGCADGGRPGPHVTSDPWRARHLPSAIAARAFVGLRRGWWTRGVAPARPNGELGAVVAVRPGHVRSVTHRSPPVRCRGGRRRLRTTYHARFGLAHRGSSAVRRRAVPFRHRAEVRGQLAVVPCVSRPLDSS